MNPAVRLRALVERYRTSLFALPISLIAVLCALAVATLWADSAAETAVPAWLQTTVPSARTILGTIATGLVAGAALVFSSILVSVQLAASQFSPRTLRGYLRDRTQQVVIGLVVGTAVYCLVVLVRTRAALDVNGDPLVPHISVLVAVLLASLSLLSIVGVVAHLARSLQVERLLTTVVNETLPIVRRRPLRVDDAGTVAVPPRGSDAAVVTAPRSGWVQQISIGSLQAASPPDGGIEITTHVGAYVWEGAPIAWVWPGGELDGERSAKVSGALALGEQRTMQEDVGFGLVRLVDVALRALSPGVNDQNTAIDVIARLGAVLVAIGERVDEPRAYRDGADDGGGVVAVPSAPWFSDHVRTAVVPLREMAVSHVQVATALVVMLHDVITELERRCAVADTRPLHTELAALRRDVAAGPLPESDAARVLGARPV